MVAAFGASSRLQGAASSRLPGFYNPRVTTGRDVRAWGSKKVVKIIKLAIEAGKANPAPPIGPALGAAGLNIMDFCKQYNAATQAQMGEVIPVDISVMDDRSFTFVLKTPPASQLILKAAGIAKGSGTPQKVMATITEDQLREIAQSKLPDLNCTTIESAMNTIQGTCRNMGVAVEGRMHRAKSAEDAKA